MRVAIIGAGIAGLAAGYRLRQNNVHPVIFEKTPFEGGRMGSERIKGFIVDRGAYTIPETHRSFLHLIQALGLSDALVETPGTASTFVGGEAHKMKIGSPKDFLKYKLLNFKSKKDLVKLFLYAQSLGRRLDLQSPTPKTLALENETVSDYLLRDYNVHMLEKIAYPIFADLFLGVPEDNSKAAFLATIRNLTRFKIFTLNPGMGLVAEKLGEILDVRDNTPVLSVRRNGKTGTYRLETGGSHPATFGFDKIIFSIPLPCIPDVLEGLPQSLRNDLKQVLYTPSIVVAMGLMEPFAGHSFMNTFLRHEIRTLATVVLDHHKGVDRIPRGKGLATAILTKDAATRLFKQSDNDVTEAVLSELDAVWPGFSSRILFARVYRWPFGAVQLPPGALAGQVKMRKGLDASAASVAFAGDGLHRASIEVSLRTGYKAADRVLGKG